MVETKCIFPPIDYDKVMKHVPFGGLLTADTIKDILLNKVVLILQVLVVYYLLMSFFVR